LGRLQGQPAAGFRLVRSAMHLARLARRERAALIHTATARAHLIGALAARLSGLPLVWRLHDDTLPLSLARLFGRIPRRVLPNSRFIAGRYLALPAPMTIIYNGVVIPARSPAAGSQRVTLAGRLVRWKGQAVFIRAMAQVRRRMPEVQGEIVGSASAADDRAGLLAGGRAYEQELRTLVEQLGLQGAVEFCANREPSTLYADTALAVHASILPEPFGRTVLEGMAAGIPVIGARGGGVPEIILNGITGRLTPSGEPDALADAIASLMLDPDRRRVMGRAGRQRAVDHFSLDRMARQFEAAWLEAIG
jgi:glycosyltransferase involved in cell wall biosynthesis